MPVAFACAIEPSRRLHALLLLWSGVLLGCALGMLVLSPERPFGAVPGAALPWLAGLLVGWRTCRSKAQPTVRRIDLSGVGQYRLTVQHDMAGPPCALDQPVFLLPGACVWPSCMLLQFGTAQGAVWPLVLLPDSMNADQFRALAVALRAQDRAVGHNPTGTSAPVNLFQAANS